jgi:transcriptional regulator with XRE-family HTH domain
MATKPTPKGDIEVALGEQFRSVRRRQKVWLRDLALKLDCSVNTVRWHEAGARMMRADVLVRAAELMGVPPEELMQTRSASDGNQENL